MDAEDLFVPDRVLDLSEAEALAAAVFGFAGLAERLWGERDQNFKITAAGGERALLKISHSAEDPAVTNLQTAMLTHIARADPTLPVPHLTPSVDGAIEPVWRPPGEPPHILRLMSFLPSDGQEGPQSQAALRALGAAGARLDLALKDFRHPGQDQDLLWDLQRMSRLRAFAGDVEDAGQRRLALTALDWFEREAQPVLPGLRRQVIHNDLNSSNVLFQGDAVSGIIDFGDAVMGPIIQEMAVSASYRLRGDGDALAPVRLMLEGYEAVLPLTAEERALLPVMMAGRLAMGILVGWYRHRRLPAEQAAIASSLPFVATRLERIMDVTEALL